MGEDFWVPPTTSPFANASLLAQKFSSQSFSANDSIRAGVSKHQLMQLTSAELVVRLHRDAYVVAEEFSALPPGVKQHQVECAAITHSSELVVVSHESAALLHGLPVGRTFGRLAPGERVQVTVNGDHRGRQPDYDVSGSYLRDTDIVFVDGIRVTSVARTAVDLARRQRLPSGQMPIDAAARILLAELAGPSADLRTAVHDMDLRRAASQELADVCRPMKGWKGVGFARQAILGAEPGSEGALETLSRLGILTSGLPKPEIGWPVYGKNGLRYWGDFAWPEFKIIGEADGALKYKSQERVIAERERQLELERNGWIVVRWNWHEAVVEPWIFIHRLREAFDQARKRHG